jgi:hypothetical protein
MKRVLGHLRQIAVETRCAVSVAYHTRKMNGGEVTADDGRGASSITGLCRDVRVLNCMSREEAEAVGIPADHRRRYISYVSDKANAALPPEKKNWFQMLSVDMENAKGEDASESIGVAVPFSYEDAKPKVSGRDLLRCQQALQDAYDAGNPGRQSYKAGDWAGHIIAKELGLDADVGSPERPIVTKLLKDWLRNGALIVDDDWTDKDHKRRPVIVVGQWAVVE